jgi:hypothetical protein
MSIPTHNLYDFVHQVTKKKFILLYFYPWGEKSLLNLSMSESNFDDCIKVSDSLLPDLDIPRGLSKSLQPVIVCHDQEPLNFNLYSDHAVDVQAIIERYKIHGYNLFSNYNLRYALPSSRQKFWILLHSEINSHELEKYEQSGLFRGAYWWSHAIIARDWYRYAKYDDRLNHKTIEKLFLIYCRDTTGSRSYRKDFLEKINTDNLHQYVNYGNRDLFPVSSTASAEYDADDFSTTGISIILETIFEDRRIHFTEKVLRAIACGHPFIVANGQGSLEVLRRYGFKTFSPWIDESYDTVSSSNDRMDLIVKEMGRLSRLPDVSTLVNQCREIAKFNQKHFFSDEFFNIIKNELFENINKINLPNFGLDYNVFLTMHRGRDHSTCDPKVVDAMTAIFKKLEHNINIS